MFTPEGRRPPSEFVISHCQNCAAGWTRTGKDGGSLTVCLLDREPVLADMTDCDRFEVRE
jgi:hypothetical protein